MSYFRNKVKDTGGRGAVNIKAVASKAGVSVGTVSNVLSGAAAVSDSMRKRVEAAIESLHYRPSHVARSLKSNSTRMLGMVISDLENAFFPLMVRGAEDAALERGYIVVTFNSDDRVEREEQLFSVLDRHRVDGILLVPACERKIRHARAMSEAGTPIVMLDRVPKRCPWDSVAIDNEAAARSCVEHLIEMGHRRIGVVTGNPDLQIANDRYAGYVHALESAGIQPDHDLVACGMFRYEKAYEASVELFERRRPTAVFVSNHVMALGLLKAAREKGVRIPQDLSLTVFDDMKVFEAMSPAITALSQPNYDTGYKAAELLIQRIEGGLDKPVHLLLQTELKIRESSHRIAQGAAC